MDENDYTVVLRSGEHLCNRAVSCPSGEYTVVHQHDGNVVIYRNDDAVATWATGTNFQAGVGRPDRRRFDPERQFGRPGRLRLEHDGNLVVHSSTGEKIWESYTSGSGASTVMIHDTGKLVLKNDAGHIVWQTPPAPWRWSGWNRVPDGRRLRRGQQLRGQTLTSDNGVYTLVTTYNGAAYLCRDGGPILWVIFRPEDSGLSMSEDGRLGAANAAGRRRPGNSIDVPHDLNAAELLVSDEGRLTLVDDAGTVLWASPPPTATAPESKPTTKAVSRSVQSLRPPIDLSDYDEFNSLVVRTDYSDDTAWDCVVKVLARPWPDEDSESGYVLIADPVWAGAGPNDVLAALPDNAPAAVFIADGQAMHADPTLLAVRTQNQDEDQDKRWFRISPQTAIEMTVNLALGNMDFDDFG